jgi:hypothetical protein
MDLMQRRENSQGFHSQEVLSLQATPPLHDDFGMWINASQHQEQDQGLSIRGPFQDAQQRQQFLELIDPQILNMPQQGVGLMQPQPGHHSHAQETGLESMQASLGQNLRRSLEGSREHGLPDLESQLRDQPQKELEEESEHMSSQHLEDLWKPVGEHLTDDALFSEFLNKSEEVDAEAYPSHNLSASGEAENNKEDDSSVESVSSENGGKAKISSRNPVSPAGEDGNNE